ncbi:MAG TPA: EamA/RhaT family transporter [Bacteroidetes bacterium]|nr:EamA/RhaT family transporter [Bacteroidota bacterium]
MTPRSKAELALFSITFIWGSTFVTTKHLLDGISPFLYVGIRFGVAALLMAIVFRNSLKGLGRLTIMRGSVLGVLLFAGFITQTIGLQYTTASKSAFITGMMVVFTPICQLLIERRAPKWGNVAGIALVTVGLYFLTSPVGSEFNIGDALTLVCAAVFGLYIVYVDVFTKDHDAAQITLVQFVVNSIFGGVAAAAFETTLFRTEPTYLLSLAYLAVFATVVAIYVQMKFQKDSTPTRSAVIFSIEPVIAAVFAYLVLGEVIGFLGIVGGGLILAGLLVSELSPA